MGRHERMTEQKGERSWWQGAADPREVGGREGGSAGTESCFTIIAHVSVASGACLNPPGHPPAAGPHRHGKARRRDAFRYRNSPLPDPRWAKGSPAGRSSPGGHPHSGQRPQGDQDQSFCGERQRFAGMGCIFMGCIFMGCAVGFWLGKGVLVVPSDWAVWGRGRSRVLWSSRWGGWGELNVCHLRVS